MAENVENGASARSFLSDEMIKSSYESFKSSYESLCNKERREHELLNSGFGAFEQWENPGVIDDEDLAKKPETPVSQEERQWRDELRGIFAEAGQWPPKPSRPTEEESKAKLRRLGWKSSSAFLLHELKETSDDGYKINDLTIDNMPEKDKAAANIVSKVRDENGHHMYFPSLMIFERQVEGRAKTSAQKTAAKRLAKMRKTDNNGKDIFVGYDNFAEIESDVITVHKWTPLLEKEGSKRNLSWIWLLQDQEEAMIGKSMLNEGLRELFMGQSPNAEKTIGKSQGVQGPEYKLTFYAAALVLCPVANILRLNESVRQLSQTLSFVKRGCFASTPTIKMTIAEFARERVMKWTTRDYLERNHVFSPDLHRAIEIFQDAGLTSYVLDLASALIPAVRDLPSKERDCSPVITHALIASTAPLFLTRRSEDRERLCGLAKERLAYLVEATENGEPNLDPRQTDAVFPPSAQFSKEVQEFLRGHSEERDFGPFKVERRPGQYKTDADAWAHANFGSLTIKGSWSTNSLEGEAEERRGKYSASAIVDEAKVTVTLKKHSEIVLKERVTRHEIHLSAKEKLMPVFGAVLD